MKSRKPNNNNVREGFKPSLTNFMYLKKSHGIIVIVEKNEYGSVGADLCVRPDNVDNVYHKGQTRRSAPTPTIGAVI